ncbi:MAG: ComEC/Rec2 family competence protein, partial [Kiloniellales bacterium]|nr:ComEC/Rec2 family competence protein [Kiloniellales bacterium]
MRKKFWALLRFRIVSRFRESVRISFFEERDRWFLWIPVLFGAGIGVYFSLLFEPSLTLCYTVLCALGFAFLLSRNYQGLRLVLISVLIVVGGFTTAALRSYVVAAPSLVDEQGPLRLEGTVLSVERRGTARRLLLYDVAGVGGGAQPERVRVFVAADIPEPLQPGSRVRMRAVLRPPPEPVAPGGFDFARQAFFDGIGAVGFAVTRPVVLGQEKAPSLLSFGHNWTLLWESVRLGIENRVYGVLENQNAAIASALLTGLRGGIDDETAANMRDSGLAHLLAISGLHMGIVAGWVFLLTRALFAAVPNLALSFAIKKWAAAIAIAAAFFYLFLAGASLPTQRAFIMSAIVFLAVIVDRRALSLRLVAWAAIIVLMATPESLLSASFQLSFAAVVGLVSFYEWARNRGFVKREELTWWQIGLFYVAGVALTSIIATLATAPFVAANFNRLALYGLAANLLAVPITALWVMPWAMASLLLMPLGLEVLALTPMGWGIEVVVHVASWIAGLPGSVFPVSSISDNALIIIVFAALWLCIWRRPWRLLSLPLVAPVLVLIAFESPPDILAAGGGAPVAIVGVDNRLALSTLSRGRFERDVWMRMVGSQSFGRWDKDLPLGRCDSLGCILHHKGRKVAYVKQPEALLEDCGSADVLISLEPLLGLDCSRPAVVLDRFDFWRNGAYAIWISGESIEALSVRAARGERPWVRKPELEN